MSTLEPEKTSDLSVEQKQEKAVWWAKQVMDIPLPNGLYSGADAAAEIVLGMIPAPEIKEEK